MAKPESLAVGQQLTGLEAPVSRLRGTPSGRVGTMAIVTEAAACGTPAVASRIAGHEDAVLHDRTGLLASGGPAFAAALDQILADDALRARLGAAARARAEQLTWGATARGTLEVLAAEALRRRTT